MKLRRTSVLLMALMLVLAGIHGAHAAPGDATVMTPEQLHDVDIALPYPQQIVLLEGTFFALGQDAVYSWQPGMEQPTLFCSLPKTPEGYLGTYEDAKPELQAQLAQVVSGIAAGDGKLWAYNVYTGSCGAVNVDGVQWSSVTLDMQDMFYEDSDAHFYPRTLCGAFIQEGVLYGTREAHDGGEWTDDRVLMRWDIATGVLTQTKLATGHIVCAYKQGQLLTFGTAWDSALDSYNGVFASLDLVSGLETPLPPAPSSPGYMGGIAYDAASDSIYYSFQGQVWQSQAGAPFSSVAYLATGHVDEFSPAWLLDGSLYAVWNDGLNIRNVDPQYKPAHALRVQGEWTGGTFAQFTRDFPDIPVLIMGNDSGTSDEIAKKIQSGEEVIDLYVVEVSKGLRSLMAKGYTADLGASQVLTVDIDRMYPAVRDVLMYDGKPGAYPQTAYADPWSVNITMWEKLGMGPLPTTYAELFDYYLRWQQDYADDYPDFMFMQAMDSRVDLVGMVREAYVLQYETPGQPINFIAPVFRDVLERIERLAFDPSGSQGDADYDEMIERPGLFMRYSHGGMFPNPGSTEYISTNPSRANASGSRYDVMLPPVFEAGQTPHIAATMQAYFINPASPNVDLAIQYLEYAAQHGIDARTRYMLHPDLTEPVVHEDFDQWAKEMEKGLDEKKEGLENAAPADRGWQQDDIDYYTRWLANQEQNKWLLSAEGIATYRSYADYIDFAADSLFLNYNAGSAWEQLVEIQTRYTEGQLTLDAFLKEMDSKMRMIFLEGR